MNKEMKIDILTIFPNMFDCYLNESILKRAQKKKLVSFKIHDIRKFTKDKHKTADDKPYGGGPGMVMKVEPIYSTLSKIKKTKKTRVVLLSAKGKTFNQKTAKRLAKYNQLILICGRYEGVDERVAKHLTNEEISIGDYVLTGGELPAMVVADSVTRLIPDVLGKKESLAEESFVKEGYLEYPHYTRPEEFKKWKVPKVLTSGDHKKIDEWRKKESKKK
ncbi:MAG: tRNA (guanosine(37)-N1)-methyltransferase TrmD [Patescibacteria group bacterium]|nr:tRNA (guanosine(37)-N1)-methyltransferase TrmD [Patescibacteria group bacterium]